MTQSKDEKVRLARKEMEQLLKIVATGYSEEKAEAAGEYVPRTPEEKAEAFELLERFLQEGSELLVENPELLEDTEDEVESALELPTTAELIADAQANRQGEAYPEPRTLLENLPVVLRGICDYTLSGQADAVSVARALASVIDVIEHIEKPYSPPMSKPH